MGKVLSIFGSKVSVLGMAVPMSPVHIHIHLGFYSGPPPFPTLNRFHCAMLFMCMMHSDHIGLHFLHPLLLSPPLLPPFPSSLPTSTITSSLSSFPFSFLPFPVSFLRVAAARAPCCKWLYHWRKCPSFSHPPLTAYDSSGSRAL